MSLVVINKILSLFVNTLIVDEKHYMLTRQNLMQTIQIQLSQKQEIFFQFFLAFLKSILHLEHSPKKDDSNGRCISEYSGSKKYG